ncbi:hypoxanthine phosphoribosyltransferase [Coriobacteriia bacterium Es71-Z0120]|uniref:hypoxanthine phosphoribosyltransferase n=1 Tax=Parvivirga hydrogeniphila TaxID=2939460 RepID=UPI0022609022|nr:hypoxanthine phosphoribosyltransferase [Parvivirga hydrogeniphila]MCL4079418.1 hypoxanthine phosphoribosyltransferase [Parvivirga hydrogeniphila]
MHPDIDHIVLTEEQIQRRVRELGAQIAHDYEGSSLLLVAVLRGAALFVADLARAIDGPVEIDFMAVSSYGSSTKSSGVVRIIKDLDEVIAGRDVLVVEDILDTGLTLKYLLRNLASRKPKSLEVVTLLSKEGKQRVPIECKYVGFSVPDEFVVGYGLDYAEKYRNLPYIGVLKPEVYTQTS